MFQRLCTWPVVGVFFLCPACSDEHPSGSAPNPQAAGPAQDDTPQGVLVALDGPVKGGAWQVPRLSADGRHIAVGRAGFDKTNGGSELLIVDLDRSAAQVIRGLEDIGGYLAESVAWHPQKETCVLSHLRDGAPGEPGICLVFLNVASEQIRTGGTVSGWRRSPAFSADGQWVAWYDMMKKRIEFARFENGEEGGTVGMVPLHPYHSLAFAWMPSGAKLMAVGQSETGTRGTWKYDVARKTLEWVGPWMGNSLAINEQGRCVAMLSVLPTAEAEAVNAAYGMFLIDLSSGEAQRAGVIDNVRAWSWSRDGHSVGFLEGKRTLVIVGIDGNRQVVNRDVDLSGVCEGEEPGTWWLMRSDGVLELVGGNSPRSIQIGVRGGEGG